MRPPLPPSPKQGTAANPIDLFIRAKLAEQKLEPSPEADRATLIRRLYFDLTGLPPTPEAVEAFVRDRKADAYERLVDSLLASPRYGERWARHWLDTVHFGETHGYDKDKLRPNAWPYRDYVIRALNQDKPYSRFAQEQLAGDVLYPDDPDGIVALGFISAGPWDYVGHVELPESKTDGLIARYNDRDDMVMTTFSTFQSLTVHCARCHDHKFDPVSQRDYYSLQAVFAGVDRANRPFDADPAVFRQRRKLLAEQRPLEQRQKEIQDELAKITSADLAELDRQLAAVQARLSTNSPTAGKTSPSNGYHSGIDSSRDTTKWVQVEFPENVTLDEIRLIPARPTDFPDTPGFGFPARFKIEVSAAPGFAQQEVIDDHTGADFKNPGDTPYVVTVKGKPVRSIRVTATRLWERTGDYVFALAELQSTASGQNVARDAKVTALDSIESGRWAKKFLVDGFGSRAALEERP
ncbi:MAG TPA: DUF1549 domain-containing protein, partial [Verrucomicrobiae bacterium]|nr:DUF1549 domain-containing protein [Verrucomicrobiae bacterium]